MHNFMELKRKHISLQCLGYLRMFYGYRLEEGAIKNRNIL